MRIAFIVIGNSRRSNYLNGETLRYGGAGGSGTDTSSILVAEYLATQGHDVVMAMESLEPQLDAIYRNSGAYYELGQKIRGVCYTNLNFDGITDRTFDVLVNSLWFSNYNSLPIEVTRGLIYWNHMQWLYGISEIIEYTKENNLSLGIINISEWERSMNSEAMSTLIQAVPETKCSLIPNPIVDDVVKTVHELNLIRNPQKFSFHASWARGGKLVYDIVDNLEWEKKELHVFDYLMNIDINWGREGKLVVEKDFLKKHGGVDKFTLLRHLAESEYFIYPLYTPYKNVHKDTFSCVVAEAIAMGNIVITYPIGALPEIFKDHCVWVDIPPEFNIEEVQSEPLTQDPNQLFSNITPFIEKIKYLETNPYIKEQIRRSGKEYILNNFNIDKVGRMWDIFINTL